MSDPVAPDLAPYRQLHGARNLVHPEAGPCFICEGRFLVEEALKDASRLRILSVVVSESLAADFRDRLPAGTSLHALPQEELEDLVGFPFHRGVLACVAIPSEPQVEEMVCLKKLLVLPRLDNVDNLGSLMRTAAALGLDGVLAGSGPGPFERRSVRVSMGAAWRLPVWRGDSDGALAELLSRWRATTGGEVVAAALTSCALPLQAWRPAPSTALMLGPEGPGLAPEWLEISQKQVAIPMCAGMDSLNVAAAGAILMAKQMGLS